MSKIICEVCGTSYPETAAQCPICGSAHKPPVRTAAPARTQKSSSGEYTYVKGGRFSQANVNKRNNTSGSAYSAKPASKGKRKKKKSDSYDNRGLIITMYDDGMTSVSFDFMFTDLSGALTGKFSGSNMTIYDLETNEAVSASALSEGTWYKLVYNPGTNIGTAAKKFTYPGGWGSEDIGGMNLYIRNLQASAS